jgi:protein tyrosine phosphatase (PTP) superfamily phosphohydrolase (DUF442 family)
MSIEQITNYISYDENLASAGMPTRKQLADVAAAGFEMVINLAMDAPPYQLPGEEELVQELGMAYVHIPVVWEAPQQGDLERFFQVMKENRERKVLVHCVANYRATAFLYLYRCQVEGMDEALASRDMEKIWKPDGVWERFIEMNLTRQKE